MLLRVCSSSPQRPPHPRLGARATSGTVEGVARNWVLSVLNQAHGMIVDFSDRLSKSNFRNAVDFRVTCSLLISFSEPAQRICRSLCRNARQIVQCLDLRIDKLWPRQTVSGGVAHEDYGYRFVLRIRIRRERRPRIHVDAVVHA